MASVHLSRRALLGNIPIMAAAAVAAVAVPSALGAAESQADQRLLDLGREFEALYRAENAAKPKDRMHGDWTAWDAAYERTSKVVHRILRLRARSFAGVRVKARAVDWCHSGGFRSFDGTTTDMKLADQIVRDLLRLAVENA